MSNRYVTEAEKAGAKRRTDTWRKKQNELGRRNRGFWINDAEYAWIERAIRQMRQPGTALLNPLEMHARALSFATKEHAGQKRKGSAEDYITHPVAVAEIARQYTNDPMVIAAAILHDTVEDTERSRQDVIQEIRQIFGSEVKDLVLQVTDIAQPGLSRTERVQINHDHAALADERGQLIKLADTLHNIGHIENLDPRFARIYLPEKFALWTRMTKAPEALRAAVLDALAAGAKILNLVDLQGVISIQRSTQMVGAMKLTNYSISSDNKSTDAALVAV